MLTDEQTKTIYNDLLDRMTLAFWLKSYTRRESKGYHLTWTEEGIAKLTFLKLIAEKLSLDEDFESPFSLDSIVHNGVLPNEEKSLTLDPKIEEAWKECVAQLKIQGDKEKLYVLIQIAKGLAPTRSSS